MNLTVDLNLCETIQCKAGPRFDLSPYEDEDLDMYVRVWYISAFWKISIQQISNKAMCKSIALPMMGIQCEQELIVCKLLVRPFSSELVDLYRLCLCGVNIISVKWENIAKQYNAKRPLCQQQRRQHQTRWAIINVAASMTKSRLAMKIAYMFFCGSHRQRFEFIIIDPKACQSRRSERDFWCVQLWKETSINHYLYVSGLSTVNISCQCLT